MYKMQSDQDGSNRAQEREPVIRSEGGTVSERLLAKLADRTFLNLWSYPTPYIDKKLRGSGDGKELCDLLVVCHPYVIIFSEKTCEWPSGDDTIAWKRWYKRAVLSSKTSDWCGALD